MVSNKERAVGRLYEECFGKHCEQASVRFRGINSVSKHFIYSTSMYSGPGSSFLFNKKNGDPGGIEVERPHIRLPSY